MIKYKPYFFVSQSVMTDRGSRCKFSKSEIHTWTHCLSKHYEKHKSRIQSLIKRHIRNGDLIAEDGSWCAKEFVRVTCYLHV